MMVLIFFDDLIVTGSNIIAILQIKTTLQCTFPIKDLGSLKYFHGIKMETSHKGLFINQRKYVLDLRNDNSIGQ